MNKNLVHFPFYPVLLGIYPALYLWAANLGQIGSEAVLRSLLVSLVFSLIVTGIAFLLLRSGGQRSVLGRRWAPGKSSALAGLALLLFFTYGSVYDLILKKSIFGFQIGYARLLIVFILLFSVGVVLILRARSTLRGIIPIANLAAIALIVFSLFQIAYYQVRVTDWKKIVSPRPASASKADPSLPDVYYIVPDGYARSDVLTSQFHYDNSKFIAVLRQRGFVVSDCSFANYPATSISLTSSLNMAYLEDLGFKQDVYLKSDDPAELYQALHQNRVRQEFAKQGYSFIAFRGFFPLNDFTDADAYYNYAEDKSRSSDLSALNFEHMAINTTLLRAFTEFYAQNPESHIWDKIPLGIYSILNPDSDKFHSRSYQWYRQHMFTFDKLVEIPDLPGKKFVYAQIYATHQPYVMRADGSFLWPINEDNFNYIPAVEYVSNRLLSVVDEILRKSPTPPIIILQADHGMGYGLEHNKMLNAYYFPGHSQDLYPTITPVNTFRLLFRDYFHQPIDLLPDHILVVDKDGTAHQEPAACDK